MWDFFWNTTILIRTFLYLDYRESSSMKKFFLKISLYSQENTCVGVSFYKTLLKRL